ncbi:VanZ family protein [Cellulomonas sp. P22]|uniref:VanZ family protein n=1 Tax=Cellulomonas sp. P22 TaxID=3373189 RepID=UPI00378EA4BD
MHDTSYEIHALPVAALLTAAGVVAVWWRLRRRGAFTALRAAAGAALCAYGSVVLTAVLLPIAIGRPGRDQAWFTFLNLTPLVNTDPADMLQNVVLFAPWGVLLPVVARVRSVRHVLLCGLVASLTIETLQLVVDVTLGGGHAADVNDLLANTLGAVVGYGILRAAMLVPALARLADAATWPASQSAETPTAPADDDAVRRRVHTS